MRGAGCTGEAHHTSTRGHLHYTSSTILEVSILQSTVLSILQSMYSVSEAKNGCTQHIHRPLEPPLGKHRAFFKAVHKKTIISV